jgi:hypothetical protein
MYHIDFWSGDVSFRGVSRSFTQKREIQAGINNDILIVSKLELPYFFKTRFLNIEFPFVDFLVRLLFQSCIKLGNGR